VRQHLASLVEDFRRHSAETAVVAHRGNRRFRTTYGELAHLSGRFAAELNRLEIAPGDRVLLWGENSAEWIACICGCLLRGVIAVPLDAAGSPAFAQRVLEDVAPRLIAGDPKLLASLNAGTTPQLLLPTLPTHLPPTPEFTVHPSVTDQTPFQIIFTSGTTSEPKGIVHTHRNVLASLQPIEKEIAKYRKYERWVHPLRFLHTLPLSHVFGQFMGLWTPALLAAELHFSDSREPARMTEMIRRERISVIIAVPRILEMLRAHILRQFPTLEAELMPAPPNPVGDQREQHAKPRTARSAWWHFRRVHRALGWKFWAVISGGATLPPDLELFWNRLGFALIQGYGMTETAALVTLNHPFKIGQGTLGQPLPGREVRLSDQGEILVRGDMLAQSTWQAGVMRPREGEWLATGDLATQSPTGELRFTGRKGDLIVTAAGLNIHPTDLESALLAQPGIQAAVVIPCDTPAGQEPVAVVLSTASEPELQSAIATANQVLAEYQRIRRFLRWPEPQFPYTSTGKLLRRQVRDWACATLAESHAGAPAPTQDILLTLIAEITGEPTPEPNDLLRLSEDLHLDSLGRVQLQSALQQRLALEIDDEAIARAQTLADLRVLIQPNVQPSAQSAPGPNRERKEGGHPERSPARFLRRAESKDPEEFIASQSFTGSRENASRPAVDGTFQSHRPSERDAYPHWPWTWPIRLLRIAFTEAILCPLVWFLAAPKITRTATELPTGPLLLIANHVTAYDGALILYALPAQLRRRVAAAMSGEMLRDLRHARNHSNGFLNLLAPASYWLITALFNVFPLPRRQGFRRSFAHAGEALDRNFAVLIFPEGTRSRTGALQPFRPGIGLLAQQSRVPILPIALLGLHELRASHRWFRSGKLEVRIGSPIPFSEASRSSDPAALTAHLEQSLRRLQSGSPKSGFAAE
jgi:long-chain acyl-CoA synthetase